jgi:hypothetical protein
MIPKRPARLLKGTAGMSIPVTSRPCTVFERVRTAYVPIDRARPRLGGVAYNVAF